MFQVILCVVITQAAALSHPYCTFNNSDLSEDFGAFKQIDYHLERRTGNRDVGDVCVMVNANDKIIHRCPHSCRLSTDAATGITTPPYCETDIPSDWFWDPPACRVPNATRQENLVAKLVAAKEEEVLDSSNMDHMTGHTSHIFGLPTRNVVKHCRCGLSEAISCVYQDVFFIHIPKTGGETIENMLGQKKIHDTVSQRKVVRPFIGKLALGEDPKYIQLLNDDSFVVTIIRNPYDRVLSWFRFCIHGYGQYVPGPVSICKPAISSFNAAGKNETLDDWQKRFVRWLEVVESIPDHGEDKEKSHREKLFFLNQKNWLVDVKTKKFMPDFVVRFERYAEDVTELFKCLALGSSSTSSNVLSHENSGSSDSLLVEKNKFRHFLTFATSALYDEKSRGIVEKWFSEDIDFFGYSW